MTLLCDSGERYRTTLCNAEWLAARGVDTAPYAQAMRGFFATGLWRPPT